MDAAAKEAMLLKSLDEFAQAVRGAASQWAKGQKASEPGEQDGIQKSAAQQGALAKLLGQYGLGGELAQTTHNCVPDGTIDLQNLNPGEIIKRAWSFRVNATPEILENFTEAEWVPVE